MKDIRGSHVSALRNTVLRKFGLQLAGGRKRTSRDVMEWKSSDDVKNSYKKLFDDEAIEDIAISAFPSLETISEEKFNDWYIYTASVCDIILNPDYPTLDISQKALEIRLRKFKVFVDLFRYSTKSKSKLKLIFLGGPPRKRPNHPWGFDIGVTGRNAREKWEERWRRLWRRGRNVV